jgi:hypothetical protein
VQRAPKSDSSNPRKDFYRAKKCNFRKTTFLLNKKRQNKKPVCEFFYEILIYYAIASCVGESWRATGYRK